MEVELYYPTVQEDGKSSERETAIVIQNLMQGKANNRQYVTLDLNSATTVITDDRFGPESNIQLMPLDSNAASENWWISNQGNGTATVNHANNALTRMFQYAIVG